MVPSIVSHIIEGVLCGFGFAVIWEWATCRLLKVGHWVKRGQYHYHHSLFGPGVWLILPWFYSWNQNIWIFGLGSGIILQHALSEGFIFVTRE